MAELIPAKDLPVTESNDVDFLCIDNDELKRKSGGGSGVLWCKIQANEDDTFTLDKTYDEMKSAIERGDLVVGKFVLPEGLELPEEVTYGVLQPMLAFTYTYNSQEKIGFFESFDGYLYAVADDNSVTMI